MQRQTAVVSAAGSSIGLAIAEALWADDWLVYICDRDQAAIARMQQDRPGIVAQFYRWVEANLADLGLVGIDLLVSNAGIAGPTARLEDQAVEQWQQTIDINLNGTFYMTRSAIPLLRGRAPGSSIINMGSTAGLLGCPLRGLYVASKWAIVGLAKTLAMELGPEGIRVNAICPGSVEGPRIDRVMAADAEARGLSVGEVEHEYKRQTSLRTFSRCEDIVAMVRYLVSSAGQRISGQAIGIDGHTESLSLDLGA